MNLSDNQVKILLERYARDQAKPTFQDEYESAQMLEMARLQHSMSLTSWSKYIGLAKTTYFHKIEILKFTREQYDKMKANGLTDGQIHAISRAKADSNNNEKVDEITSIDIAIKQCDRILSPFATNHTVFSQHTKDLLLDFKNTINRIEMHLDRPFYRRA